MIAPPSNTQIWIAAGVTLLRDGETVTQLLTRLDLAIAKALTEGIRTDEVNPISQQYFPKT
jgi:hypothetical protein